MGFSSFKLPMRNRKQEGVKIVIETSSTEIRKYLFEVIRSLH